MSTITQPTIISDAQTGTSHVCTVDSQTELMQTYWKKQMGGDTAFTKPCQEWWDKLHFFIGFSSYNLSDAHKMEDDYVLHDALTISDTPTSLVELLIRLLPNTQ